MTSSLVALNICIIPPRPIVEVALKACGTLCDPLKGTSNYYTLKYLDLSSSSHRYDDASPKECPEKECKGNLGLCVAASSPQHGFPHCTLYQLYAHRNDIPSITAAVSAAVKKAVSEEEIPNPSQHVVEKDNVQEEKEEKESDAAKTQNPPAPSGNRVLVCEGTLSPGPVFGKLLAADETEKEKDLHVPSIVITNEGIVTRLHEATVRALRPFNVITKDKDKYKNTFTPTTITSMAVHVEEGKLGRDASVLNYPLLAERARRVSLSAENPQTARGVEKSTTCTSTVKESCEEEKEREEKEEEGDSDEGALAIFKAAFGTEWPANTASAQWTLNFEEKASFGGYFPHITLGACVGKPDGECLRLPAKDESDKVGIPISFSLDDSHVVVSEMANNCCCYKILSVI